MYMHENLFHIYLNYIMYMRNIKHMSKQTNNDKQMTNITNKRANARKNNSRHPRRDPRGSQGIPRVCYAVNRA